MNIGCNNVSIAFRGKTYLENVTFELKQDEIVLVYGPPGSGKTSLFNILCGFILPCNQEASIYWDNYQLMSVDRCNKRRYKYLSVMYSHFYFLHNLSVKDNIFLPGIFTGWNKVQLKERLELLCNVFSFEDDLGEDEDNISLKRLIEKKDFTSLSNGQKEMVGIARAFLLDAPFIMADEMLRSYNTEARKAIWKRIFSEDLGLKNGKSLFMITHDDDLAKDAKVDTVYKIKGKRLVKCI